MISGELLQKSFDWSQKHVKTIQYIPNKTRPKLEATQKLSCAQQYVMFSGGQKKYVKWK